MGSQSTHNITTKVHFSTLKASVHNGNHDSVVGTFVCLYWVL